MTRARELARLGNTNVISVDANQNIGIGTLTPDVKLDVVGDAEVSGVITATTFSGAVSGDASGLSGSASVNTTGIITAASFSGSGSGLTGVASTDNIITSGIVTITNATDSTSTTTGALKVTGGVGIGLSLSVGGDVSIGGTLTYEDVTNIDSVGLITARSGIQYGTAGAGGSITSLGDAVFVGIVTASEFYGDGANLTGLPAGGIEVESGGSSLGAGVTLVNFASGATVTASGAGSTITISAGISTQANTASGIVSTLYLGSAQDHKCTTTGFVTFTSSGGSEGDSHTLRIESSGISTIGFSTYFLWPSGGAPNLNGLTDGSIQLISFTVNRVGTAGTQLLAGASLNFS